MFFWNFSILNPFPFKDTKGNVDHWLYKHGECFDGNKAWEIEGVVCEPFYILNLTIDTRFFGHDHAGFRFELSVFGYDILLSFYDTRHWNKTKRCWDETIP